MPSPEVASFIARVVAVIDGGAYLNPVEQRRIVDIAEDVQREQGDAFLAGRKQGWQDAGLSLDAQDTLAAALNTAPEREAL